MSPIRTILASITSGSLLLLLYLFSAGAGSTLGLTFKPPLPGGGFLVFLPPQHPPPDSFLVFYLSIFPSNQK